jgi:periplasmic protein TonB
MNWPRLIGLSLALCLHGCVLYAFIAHPQSSALVDGSGSDKFTVVAEVSLESADFFTQSKQDAAVDASPVQATPPPVSETPEPKIEPQDKSEAGMPLEARHQEPPPEQQQTMNRAASIAAEAQDDQQAAAALAARRSESLSLYSADLFSTLERHKTHIAKIGDVVLQFTIAPSGRLLDRAVIQSSGIAELDRAALAALERSAPFRPIPADLSSGPLSFTIPFQFRIR